MTVRTLVLGAAAFLAACSTATGPAATPRWHLVEEARIGGKDEGPAGFADVRGIVVDARGQLWVLEAGSQEIRVFDSTGRHLRTLGRRGKGPGEFEYADGLTATPDGTVWVDDPTNSRMTGFSLDGAFAGQINAPTSGSGYVAAGGVDSLGRIWNAFITVNPKPTSDEDRSSRRFRRFTVDRTRADTVDQPQCGVRGDRIRSFIRGPGGA